LGQARIAVRAAGARVARTRAAGAWAAAANTGSTPRRPCARSGRTATRALRIGRRQDARRRVIRARLLKHQRKQDRGAEALDFRPPHHPLPPPTLTIPSEPVRVRVVAGLVDADAIVRVFRLVAADGPLRR